MGPNCVVFTTCTFASSTLKMQQRESFAYRSANKFICYLQRHVVDFHLDPFLFSLRLYTSSEVFHLRQQTTIALRACVYPIEFTTESSIAFIEEKLVFLYAPYRSLLYYYVIGKW